MEHREAKATGALSWGAEMAGGKVDLVAAFLSCNCGIGAKVRAGSVASWLTWLKALGLCSTSVVLPLFSPRSAIVHDRENAKEGWGDLKCL